MRAVGKKAEKVIKDRHNSKYNSINADIPTELNAKTFEDLRDYEIFFCYLRKKNYKKLRLSQVLDTELRELYSRDPFIMIFYNLEDEDIWMVREKFGLHSVMDSELQDSFFNNKDSVIAFEDYLFVCLNDISWEKDNPEYAVSMKIIKKINFLLIFAKQDHFCLDKIFFNPSKNEALKAPSFIYLKAFDDSFGQTEKIPDPVYELDNNEKLSLIESELIRIFEVLLCRIEAFVAYADKETKKSVDSCGAIGLEENVEFASHSSYMKKKLVFLNDLIDSKSEYFNKMIECPLLSDEAKVYFKCFLLKISMFQQRLRIDKNMIKLSDLIYENKAGHAMTIYSAKLCKVSRYFSAVTTIFLPIILIPAYFGMNVRVPFRDVMNYNPFIAISCVIIGIFISLATVFRIKKWI